jgi:hypothetical protein
MKLMPAHDTLVTFWSLKEHSLKLDNCRMPQLCVAAIIMIVSAIVRNFFIFSRFWNELAKIHEIFKVGREGLEAVR